MKRKRKIGVTLHKCDLCEYQCKQAGSLKRHKAFKHNIGVTWHKCDLCEYQCKTASSLKMHKALKHNIDVTWHRCDLCEYQCKQAGSLKQHRANKHNLGVTWYQCDLCEYQCKEAGNLKHHQANKHNIGVIWHRCKLCNFQCKAAGILKRHKANKHNIGIVWRRCKLCNFQCKAADTLKQHQANKHNIGVIWHRCKICNFQCKAAGILKQHQANKHNIDVTWHRCDLCEYQCKKASSLKRHNASMHDIGTLECQICFKSCGKLFQQSFRYGGLNGSSGPRGSIGMCRQCCREYGIKKDRIEHRYMKEIDKHVDFPASDDKRVGGDACLRYRPDRLYLDASKQVHVHVECDEHQHLWSSGSYDCEERRISEIYDEFATNVPEHYVVIRFNPDEYDKNNLNRNKVFAARAKRVAETIQHVRRHPPPEKISIVYMYYSRSHPQIAKNLPVYFVDDDVDEVRPLAHSG